MDKREQIEKTRAVILGVLALSNSKVLRTKLVKLVYLADQRFFESTGRTITRNLYMWDHFGPNAVGNAISNEANELAFAEKVRMVARPSVYDGYLFEYWVEDPNAAWAVLEATLDEGERQIIVDIVKQFGRFGVNAIVSKSKETPPFASAEQYDLLHLVQSDNALKVRAKVENAGEFLEEVELSLKELDEEDEWVWDNSSDQ